MKRLSLLRFGAALALSGFALLGVEALASAESVDELGREVSRLDTETSRIYANVEAPVALSSSISTRDNSARQIVDAKLYYGMENYDDAAVILYDFVEKNASHPAYDEGLFFLADSLYKKGDLYASRTYFSTLVNGPGASSKFYERALERLVELNIELDDSADEDWISLIEGLPASQQGSASPYVRGKYDYYKERYDAAIAHFDSVPKNSEQSFQALYYKGVAQVSKGDLKGASESFRNVSTATAETPKDARVVELSHLALGRLYYERDQPSKAIDAYLNVDRKSDLFDEALYEVAWVYIKAKEQSKALQALELLELADPKSHRMPEVRILEGNLRIQRARAFAADDQGNPIEEYDKAIKVFEETHDAFAGPRENLAELIEKHPNPSVFLSQITGRERTALSADLELSEVATAWLKQEPDVARVVNVEHDLGQIESEIGQAEATIARLELALGSSARVNLFPKLANKRIRTIEIEEELYKLRAELADQGHDIASRYAGPTQKSELERLRSARVQIQREAASLPNAKLPEGERIGRSKQGVTTIDNSIAEATTIARTTEAQLRAVENYFLNETSDLSPDNRKEIQSNIEETRSEVNALNKELDLARSDTVLARDQVGVGDQTSYRRGQLRASLDQALRAEEQSLGPVLSAASGNDQPKSSKLKATMSQAASVQLRVVQSRRKIDSVANSALAEVQTALQTEKQALAEYRSEYTSVDSDSEVVGSDAIRASFAGVLKKFDEIVIQTDVGLVDVAWSLRESVDDGVRRMTLAQARERRTLDAEFASIMRDIDESEANTREKADADAKGGQ